MDLSDYNEAWWDDYARGMSLGHEINEYARLYLNNSETELIKQLKRLPKSKLLDLSFISIIVIAERLMNEED